MNSTEVAFNKLKDGEILDRETIAALLEESYFELTGGKYSKGLEILGLLLEIIPKDNSSLMLLAKDCIQESRVFHYSYLLKKVRDIQIDEHENALTEYVKGFYSVSNDRYLTREQIDLIIDFEKFRRLVISAPTSFGKSMLMSEIIKRNEYQNVAVVVPTKALINETFNIMFNDLLIRNRYKIINSTNSKVGDSKNLVILTPERMDAFLDENSDIKFDFFAMDEIYKVDNPEDERSRVFSNVLYRLSLQVKDFYLIGPYFEGFSARFLKKTQAKFKRYESQVVQKRVIDLANLQEKESFRIFNKEFKKFKGVLVNLNKLLPHAPGTSLVYVGGRQRCESVAGKIASKNVFDVTLEDDFINYLEAQFPSDWKLIQYLKRGVAFHHAAMPKFIQLELLNLINNELIKCIVCTPTIIEGVNTSAKNVFIVDSTKGKKNLSDLDILNIQGRAGRFSTHFSGNVIRLAPHAKDIENETSNVEFPLLDNDDLPIEDTLFLDQDDLKGKNKKKREMMERFLEKNQVPLELIKLNKYIHFQNQAKLFLHFRKNPKLKKHFGVDNITKVLLDEILTLCYDFLFSNQDLNDKNFTKGQLFRFTKYYVFKSPTIPEMLSSMPRKSTDAKVRSLFYLMNHYFEFALPKYLKAFETIFNSAYRSNLSLGLVIKKLEYGVAKDHEIIFKEMGLPSSMIQKISSQFDGCKDISEILIKGSKLKAPSNLHAFESSLFRRLFK
jgi:helicase